MLTESRAKGQDDLAGGHTSGTFYIRARDRAGACVPAVSETLVPSDQMRVAARLAVWTLSLRSYRLRAADSGMVLAVGQRPSATHPTSGVGGERKSAGQTGGKRRETDDFRSSFAAPPVPGEHATSTQA